MQEEAALKNNWNANEIKSVEEELITNIPERFHEPLMKIPYKLLSRDEATFDEEEDL